VLAGCISDYNPFTDTANVDVSFATLTVADGDTVEIFAAETIQVSVLVAEQVELLRVSASANRSWSDTDTVITGADLRQGSLRFVVSFYDTGRQYVALTTEGGGQALSTDSFRVYARSPLAPDTVSGVFGDTVTVRTAPVRAPRVSYVWSFGPGSEFTFGACSAGVVVVAAADSAEGTLRVTDGRYVSPAVPFAYRFVDTAAPVVRCINTGYAGGDTVYTSDSSFNLRVTVTDRGILSADSVVVNGEAFDFAFDTLYLKLFTGMHLHPPSDPARAEVFAMDRIPGGNAVSRVFYLAFVDTAPPTEGVTFTLTQPGSDSVTTSADTFLVTGTLMRGGADTVHVYVEASVNGGLTVDSVVLDAPVAAWSRQLVFADSVNRLVIRVLDSARAETLALVERTVFFDSLLADTSAPRIVYVRVGAYNASRYISTVARVLLRVNATDQGVGVDSVFCNDIAMPPYTTAGWWADSVTLVHGTAGNEFRIRARDRYGNDTSTTVVVFLNRRPVFEIAPKNATIDTDTLYRDTIAAIDPDGDALKYTKTAGPAGLQVTVAGVITWRPTSADTGTFTVTLAASDPYQSTGHVYLLHVADLGSFTPVQFVTRASNFPSYLTAGEDTLSIALRVDSASGVRPYLFTARVVTEGLTLLNQSASNLLRWAPDTSQLGTQQLMVVVRDNIGSSDTIYPRIVVVPPNAPCSLTVRYSSPTLPGGVADLNALQGPDTLRFRIVDPDDPAIERHTVTLHQARSGVTTVFDSTSMDTFRLVIDPRTMDGADTVVATVVDRAGHRDTVVQPLSYGTAPAAPSLLAPALGATGLVPPVALQWQGSDPDGDALVYDVYVGTSAASLFFLSSTGGTTYPLSGLAGGTTYYWQIRASDWKRTSASAVYNFRTQ